MPKRPRQHEIDELAQRAFRKSLPASWVVNPFTTDYAKDYIVEIVEKTQLTGTLFIVQLKGKESLPRQRGKNFVSVGIDYEHLRYYLNDVPLPVFIVAVDVSSGKAYFEFAQRQTPRDFKAKGRASYRIPISNRLADTAKVIAAVHSAWDFMRDKYPGSLAAAAKVRQDQLKKLDPRLECNVTLRDGKEHIEFRALEPIDIKVSFLGSKKAVAATQAMLIGEGKPAKAHRNLKIKIEGSPIFDMHGGSVAQLSFSPQLPIEVRIFARSSKLGAAELPEFRGKLAGGTKQQRFEGSLPNCPISCKLHVESTESNKGTGGLTWKWDSREWDNARLVLLPWLDQIWSFLTSIVERDATLGFQVFTAGTKLLEATPSASPTNLTSLRELLPYVETLRKARHVCRLINLDPRLPALLSDRDFEDIEELFNLVTTGRYVQRSTFTLSFNVDRLAEEQQKGFRQGDGVVTQRFAEAKYNFLGLQFDFSDAFVEFFGWERADISSRVVSRKPATAIRLENCRRRLVWQRFAPTAEPAVEQ